MQFMKLLGLIVMITGALSLKGYVYEKVCNKFDYNGDTYSKQIPQDRPCSSPWTTTDYPSDEIFIKPIQKTIQPI